MVHLPIIQVEIDNQILSSSKKKCRIVFLTYGNIAFKYRIWVEKKVENKVIWNNEHEELCSS